MADTNVGTGTLLRLALRRDRVLLTAWSWDSLRPPASAAATVDLYPTEAERVAAAETINASAAVVALYGRIYDPTSLGAVSMIRNLTALGAAIVGIVMLFVAIRHTRAEEAGRLERSAADVSAASHRSPRRSILITGASVVLALLTRGRQHGGGSAVNRVARVRSRLGAVRARVRRARRVTAQVAETARAARGSGSRSSRSPTSQGVGDLAEPGPSFWSWLSPIGWNQQLRAYSGERWWVLVLPLLATALLMALAYARCARAATSAARCAPSVPGPATGRLGTGRLAWRLQSRVLLGWSVAFVLFGLILGRSRAASTTADVAGDAAVLRVHRRHGAARRRVPRVRRSRSSPPSPRRTASAPPTGCAARSVATPSRCSRPARPAPAGPGATTASAARFRCADAARRTVARRRCLAALGDWSRSARILVAASRSCRRCGS